MDSTQTSSDSDENKPKFIKKKNKRNDRKKRNRRPTFGPGCRKIRFGDQVDGLKKSGRFGFFRPNLSLFSSCGYN
jgi:hypothetical protein